MTTIRIPVEGMSCHGCVSSVEKALARLPGVEEAKAELSPGGVTVRYDPARIGVLALVEGIDEAGYGVPAAWRAEN